MSSVKYSTVGSTNGGARTHEVFGALRRCPRGLFPVELVSGLYTTTMKAFLTFAGLLLLPASQCAAAVAVDSVGPNSSGVGAPGATSLSWSHTVTSSGSNLALVVGVGVGARPDDGLTLSVTYNSVPMTSAGLMHANDTDHGFVQMFCLAAPATGTHTVAVSLSGGTGDLVGGSISFTGVNQTTPCTNTVTAYSYSTSVSVAVTSTAGDMVVDAVGTGTGVSGSTQTLEWLKNLNSNTADANAAQSVAAGASTVTMGYTGSYDYWGIIGVDLAAASGSTGGGSTGGGAGPCDLNQDGVINGADVTLGVNMSLGTTTCTASIEGPNICTVITVQRVVNASLGQTCITYNTHGVILNWTASSGPNVTYNVYRGSASTGPFSQLNSTAISALTYADTSVQAGQTYYYVLTAVSASGQSAYSSPAVQATIPNP
jgi:hypothetical protein